jgi:hypothetical protein
MYKLLESDSGILRIEDGAKIPKDATNIDYQKYLAWIEDGNEPLPADVAVISIPSQVPLVKAKLVLLQSGKLDQVNEIINSLPEDSRRYAQIVWEYAPSVDRSNSLVAVIKEELGLSEEELDQMFLDANSIIL